MSWNMVDIEIDIRKSFHNDVFKCQFNWTFRPIFGSFKYLMLLASQLQKSIHWSYKSHLRHDNTSYLIIRPVFYNYFWLLVIASQQRQQNLAFFHEHLFFAICRDIIFAFLIIQILRENVR